ncbi:phosphoglycerate mutase [Nannizzia gypsea CBS 118893]|uniref:Phosphoglycerate mutase n=1 Tax=Arthroderma gypseum (strain ATCC MYA-4604 / CBS 118893) TaxID=535722 RepID=E4UXW3_ARTGP|nr:phosphoglycerate mutase [Nannizzia gypsea CBS 118893]EFR02795.1 phosphoglycerate mutase [Nannizzia gypsea CBS 118893]
MSDKSAGTPRVYICRHGETEWSKVGQHTGKTDIELTARGVQQIQASGRMLIGPNKLIEISKVAHVYISPRKRAYQTFELAITEADRNALAGNGRISRTERLAEWDYGDYEGLVSADIQRMRKERGLDKERNWNIWQDGCEGGESPEQVSERVDSLIEEIRGIQGPNINGEKACNIILFAHGHLLRAFVKRWLNIPIGFPLRMMLEAGGIGVLSYDHHDINQPAILVGIGLPSPPV